MLKHREREHINASHHLACHSVHVSAMAKKLSLQEVLDHITDQENSGSIAGIEEETTEDESYSEDALQDILEEENHWTSWKPCNNWRGAIFWFWGPSWSWCNILVEGWKFVLVIISNWEERQIIHRKCHKDDTRVDKICHIPHWRHKIMLQPVSGRAYWKHSHIHD